MTTLREAAQQALEALERADKISGHGNNRKAIIALRVAIAEATIKDNLTVEPVAWLQIGVGDHEGTVIVTTTEPKTWNPAWWKFKPLYTVPPKREPLTDDEIRRIDDATPFHENVEWEVRFARAIERAHGIGGEE